MKNIKYLSLLFLVSLVSCGASKTYSLSDYEINVDFTNENFKIMQLTDIHLGIEVDNRKEMKQIKKYIDDNNPDMIVITGDTFLDSTKSIVKYFFNTMDSYGIPYAFTYGNHDLQGSYNSEYIHSIISKSSVALYKDYKDDNIYGRTNYYINLKKGGSILYRLYIVDSNSYAFVNGAYEYDIIHDDQLKHIEDINKAAPAFGLAFFHIPLLEYQETYDKYVKDEAVGKGENREPSCPGYVNNNALKRMYDSNIRATFVGHDHINYSDLIYKGFSEDFILCYGVKATKSIYADDDVIGCKMITLSSNSIGIGLDNIEAKFYGYGL